MEAAKFFRIIIYFLLSYFWLPSLEVYGQTKGYFVQFADKVGTPYTIDKPLEFLSQRAVNRRMAQGIPLDISDLPVSPSYVSQLEDLGVRVVFKSKWLNGVIAISDNSDLMLGLNELPFVDFVELTYVGDGWPLTAGDNLSDKKLYADVEEFKNPEALKSRAGYSDLQIEMLRGDFLHDLGFNGDGIHIAVLDAGFLGVDVSEAFHHLHADGLLLGEQNFVINDSESFYNTHIHGAQVLSVMTGQVAGYYSGTATEASYWLMRTEDDRTEYPIEADYWVCAAEMADSAGVDIIQSSLGYFMFDDPAMDYSFDLASQPVRISRAASLASEKGMIVVNSAGNERRNQWGYIAMPADAPAVLAVGAVKPDLSLADFSSRGYVGNGGVKPDVMALGWQTAIISNDALDWGYGTSFAAPIVSGLTACLWQSLPDKTASEIVNLIRRSSDRYEAPDEDFGYGLPDFEKAYLLGSSSLDRDSVDNWIVTPNPFISGFDLYFDGYSGKMEVALINLYGQVVWKDEVMFQNKKLITPGVALQPGVYVLSLKYGTDSYSTKVIKSPSRR
jgi:subtilisin family serine protease